MVAVGGTSATPASRAALGGGASTGAGGATLGRGFGNHRLLDVDQPVIERQPVLLALLDCAGERLEDVVVNMAADRLEIVPPERFEDQPVGGLCPFEELGDVKSRIGGK